MKINNKNFKDWSEEDLRTLLNNEDFRGRAVSGLQKNF